MHVESLCSRASIAWNAVKDVNEEQCVRCMQRAFRKVLQARRVLSQLRQKKLRDNAANKIQAAWVRHRARETVIVVRKQKAAKLLIRKRIQEVAEATKDAQRVVRGFLAKRYCARLRAVIHRRNQAACVIQRMVRSHQNRTRFAATLQTKKRDAEQYLVAQLRRHSATKIQSLFRMYSSRQWCARMRHFLLVERHVFARKIQVCVRVFLARQKRQKSLALKVAAKEAARQESLRWSAATRIQAVFRQYAVRKEYADLLDEPKRKRRTAAVKIQRTWRAYAARTYVERLLAAKRHREAEKRTEEHMEVYAVHIQSFVRQKILAASTLDAAAEAMVLRKVQIIQRAVRRHQGEHHYVEMLREAAVEDAAKYDTEEKLFAVIRLQKTCKGFLVRMNFKAIRMATVLIQRWWKQRCAVRLLQTLREERRREEDRINQREREEAAIVIQVAWRRFLAARKNRRRAEVERDMLDLNEDEEEEEEL